MPALSEDGCFFFSMAGYRCDVAPTLDRSKKRVIIQLAKVLSESFQIIVSYLLVGKGKYMVFSPRLRNFGYLVF